jgi:mannose-6-phosphate isomerase-like protein (cupin superfamily)
VSSAKIIEKSWGCEVVYVSNDLYCLKRLIFYPGKWSSYHFHRPLEEGGKDESWVVEEGLGKLYSAWHDVLDEASEIDLLPGMIIRLKPEMRHKVRAITKLTILEVSTPDDPDNVVRVVPSCPKEDV